MSPIIQQTIDGDRPLIEPLTRLVRAYDRAIHACEAFDHAASREAIGVLRCALELDSSASRSFDALYAWCEEAVDCRDFVGAAQCLRTLRNAWRAATNPSADVPTSLETPPDRWSETRSVIVPRTDIPVS
ncbi:MAG TPA: hypothetical protein DGD08_14105 [Gemmatimonas aurantiaca]|uniref:Uncharacterized protein n=2 Tax=Gemmatimonas aurantiaca TaxID=173480 RepID=C1AA60_GEMAT|nr:hypothetical protein [Gemmatimonas aurantiaca]BAH39658.1 hypothetical protein GAU_2616 [Gemmatimonas aurantiaca T-27]HCT58333.1 hypothetical protein [Gemmatimonas aurantiaca]